MPCGTASVCVAPVTQGIAPLQLQVTQLQSTVNQLQADNEQLQQQVAIQSSLATALRKRVRKLDTDELEKRRRTET